MYSLFHKSAKESRIFFAVWSFVFLFPIWTFAQRRPPFSDKTVKMENGSLLMPHTKGEVEISITGSYKQELSKICSIINSWDSINPLQGMKVYCYGYENNFEIYFLNYFHDEGKRFAEEGGPHMNLSINDPLSIVGRQVTPGIFLCPQKTADFYGYPIYNIGREITVITKFPKPLYLPVSQEEYLKTLIAEANKMEDKYTPPNQQDYQKQLQEMEKSYREALKHNKEAAEAIQQAIVEMRNGMNESRTNDNHNVPSANSMLLSELNNQLAAMTNEERKMDAYYGGESISQLMPYSQREYGTLLVKINPKLIEEVQRRGIHLLVISWTVSSDSNNEDKPRFYNKSKDGIYHTDYLMTELYKNQKIWSNIFGIFN